MAKSKRGFTLIELSIVLVIIGLIVGGVLVGRDLISAAEVRAQVTQIEKYNSAVNTFNSKYGGIPGDLAVAQANQFGFTEGQGCSAGALSVRNGDGLLEGWFSPNQYIERQENILFWMDLSMAGLIDGTYPNSGMSTPNCYSGTITAMSATSAVGYFPAAKIGRGNYVYVYGGYSGYNWYAISAVQSSDYQGILTSNSNIGVMAAYKIDLKIDDGLPGSGNVQAYYLSGGGVTNAPNTTVSGGNATSCYDTTTNTYSASFNNGTGGNCALSLKMQ